LDQARGVAWYLPGPVEARQISEENIREVAEWLEPEPGTYGYSWYSGRPARIWTSTEQLVVPIGHWIVRTAGSALVISPEEFERRFISTP
jgi:hypothetical protein